MNCRRVTNLLSAYVDGELTGVEMLEIRRHLSECGECAEECEDVRFTKHTLSQLGNVVPRANFAVCIAASLDEVTVPRYQKLFNSVLRHTHRKLSPVAAALAAAGLALVIMNAGGVDYLGETAQYTAPSQMSAPVRNVAFFHESGAPGLTGPEPLRLAAYSSDSDAVSLQMASLTTK